MNRRPVRCILEDHGDIRVVFDDNGEELVLGLATCGLEAERTKKFGNPNDFVIHGNNVPELQPGEIVWLFCLGCGMDYLQWPGKCSCGSTTYEKLGTMQGIKWRKIKFGDDFKYRCVKPMRVK